MADPEPAHITGCRPAPQPGAQHQRPTRVLPLRGISPREKEREGASGTPPSPNHQKTQRKDIVAAKIIQDKVRDNGARWLRIPVFSLI